MKDQYVGDINDYRKYGLIRCLLESEGLSLLCGWMLTPDDGSRDGSLRDYLEDPEKWRRHDPPLFDALKALSGWSKTPGVSAIEWSSVLPKATFVSDVLRDDRASRADYFAGLTNLARSADLVFLDPDIGFEVRSKPRGRKDSSRYVFWDEVAQAYSAGASVLVYQHFPRVKREPFIRKTMKRFREETGSEWTASFATSNVLFALAAPPRHAAALAEGCRLVEERWGDEFGVEAAAEWL